MKPSLRLFKTLLTAHYRGQLEPLDEAVTRWQVGPGDLDVFGHMNNGRYLQLMDYARLDFMMRVGLLPAVVKNRWTIPLGTTQVDFRAPLTPFQKFEIGTRFLSYDDRWFYIAQTFRTLDSPTRLIATGYVKALFRAGRKTVAPKTVIRMAIGEDVEAPELSDEVRTHFGLSASATSGPDAASPAAEPTQDREPIAIVGVGCRLPGGVTDPGGLWETLLNGRDCIVDIPGSRWDATKFLDPSGRAPGRSYVQKAGVLSEDPKGFDAAFFGIPPREAGILDPQQRLLLECTWEAFEDAGEPPGEHAGARTGVFMGGFMMDNQLIRSDSINRERITSYTATASALTMLSNRLSYVFDLRGPSVSLDTACSSSLVAIHQACQSIWSGESDAAIAGGANVLLWPQTQITMTKGRFLSKTGRCHAFSDQADGYVRGEGAVVLLLKPLSAARRDGNTVYAQVLGTAANQDGRTNGITVPNGDSQIAVMRSAYGQAGIAARHIGYVEAHGTGTPVGDPIEAKAIGTVVGAERDDQRCLIGSIKTNIGHLEAAAGAAGVLKAALCVKHGVVPPNLHLSAVNPAIDLDALNLLIPTQPQPLTRLNGRRLAGVNSFGFGGTNAHLVLAEPPADLCAPAASSELVAPSNSVEKEPVLVLSARSPQALRDLAQRHAEALTQSGIDLRSYCRSAAVHRSHHSIRTSFRATDPGSLADSLRLFSQSEEDAFVPALDAPKVCFVFTGMGPQHWAMGRELLKTQTVFREAAEECDEAFRQISGSSILAELLADEAASRMAHTEVAQPANAVLQIALTRLWRSWGVSPDGVLGHSVGELAAAYASGALSLAETMRVVYHRSRLQARLAGRGAMLAAALNPVEMGLLVEQFGERVSVAAINGPSSLTLSGERAALDQIAAELAADGRFHRFLEVEVPYHCAVMNEIHDELSASLADLQTAEPAVRVYSTATGAAIADERHDAAYWWQNVRGTVLFADAVQAAVADEHRIFLEVGPHPVLAASIRDVLGETGAKGAIVASLTRGAPELDSMRGALQSLYAAGALIDWRMYFGPGSYQPVPKYPWQNVAQWDESERSYRRRVAVDRHPMISDVEATSPRRIVSDVCLGALPFLEDHQVGAAVLFPAAGHVELALAARAELTQNPSCSVEEIDLKVAVALDPDTTSRLAVTIQPDSSVLSIHHEQADVDPVLCVRAKVFSCGRIPPPADLKALQRRLPMQVSSESLYAGLAEQGLRYGPRFQSVTSMRRAEGEVLAELALPDGVDVQGYHLHPVLLDGAFHSLIAAVDERARQDLIPVGIERVHFFGGSSPVSYSYGRMRQAGTDGITGDLTLLAADGTVVAEVRGFTCQFLPRAAEHDELQQRLYARTWIPLKEVSSAATAPWVCIEDGDDDAVLHQLSQYSEPASLVDRRWATPCGDVTHPVEHGAQLAEQLLRTVNALPPGRVARVFLITTRAEMLDGDDHAPAIDTAALLGLARTVMSERPDLALTAVDMDAPMANDELFEVLGRIGAEQEVALRNGQLFCARLNRTAALDDDVLQQDSAVPVTPGDGFTLELASTGTLDDMAFVPCERRAPGPEEVEIEVELAPLGFKDVLKATGLISERVTRGTASGSSIGMEVAGRITAVGGNVTSLQVGDRVHGLACEFGSHEIAPHTRVVRLPDSISLEASAGLHAILTAYYGLAKMAQLKAGETVLIHGATGGVGLAALEIAKWIGAEVIATAGSDEKRNYLRTLGIQRVTTSRDVSFADDVMSWTAGRGVDVVLNFSPGELMTKSVACLAPFGRFIEIGKMSFDQDAPLPLRPFNENLTYASMDFDRLVANRPEYVAQLYDEVLALMVDGKINALPVTVFPASRVSEAFRLMARAKHMGKLCVAMTDPELTLRASPPPRIRSDATYLVTGGLGGFGLKTAAWLAEQGARHLCLVSRRGAASPESHDEIERLARHGVDVHAFAADVGQREQLAGVLDEISNSMPPLRGVIHSAAVLDDRRITELDRTSLDRVLGPKALGAWHLHSLTSDLDFFVMYSSISSLIGNPAQGNYVAANAVLDALAAYRRRHGLAASVINWGVLGETGLVARDANVARHLEQLGLSALSTDDALRTLAEVIDRDLDSVVAVKADWTRLASAAVPGSGERRLQLLVQAERSTAKGTQAAALFDGLSDEARQDRAQVMLAKIVADAMGMKEPTFTLSQPLRDAGMDSFMGLEIATSIERSLGVRMSAVELSSGPSIEQLAGTVLRRI